jgi:hypothetical protein
MREQKRPNGLDDWLTDWQDWEQVPITYLISPRPKHRHKILHLLHRLTTSSTQFSAWFFKDWLPKVRQCLQDLCLTFIQVIYAAIHTLFAYYPRRFWQVLGTLLRQRYQSRIEGLTLAELRRLHPELRINGDFRKTSRGTV